MNLRAALVLLISGLGITTQPSLADPITFTVTLFDVPGSTSTAAYGINNAGQIVGTYTDSAGNEHGFLDTNGTFTTLDFPGSTGTTAYGINNVGQIVGSYSGGAFLYQNGTYTPLNLPFPISPISKLGINDVGQIAGTGGGAFLYANGQVTFLPPYNSLSGPYSFAYGINNAGAIVGMRDVNGFSLPYVYANGQYTVVGNDTSNAYGINNAGDILIVDEHVPYAVCLTNLSEQVSKGCIPSIDPHERGFLGIGYGLNDSDQIVGSYFLARQGFLATPVPEPASVLLFAAGLTGMGLLLHRRKAQ